MIDLIHIARENGEKSATLNYADAHEEGSHKSHNPFYRI